MIETNSSSTYQFGLILLSDRAFFYRRIEPNPPSEITSSEDINLVLVTAFVGQ
ncbi:hypothetical protein ACJX0J_037741, partial [Zea mays]